MKTHLFTRTVMILGLIGLTACGGGALPAREKGLPVDIQSLAGSWKGKVSGTLTVAGLLPVASVECPVVVRVWPYPQGDRLGISTVITCETPFGYGKQNWLQQDFLVSGNKILDPWSASVHSSTLTSIAEVSLDSIEIAGANIFGSVQGRVTQPAKDLLEISLKLERTGIFSKIHGVFDVCGSLTKYVWQGPV